MSRLMTFGEAYARAYTGTRRMHRLSWTRGHSLLVTPPDHPDPKLVAEVLLGNADGYTTFPYTLTSVDFSATDWCAD